MQGVLYSESSFGVFIFATCILGGLGAWLTGRACASTWHSPFVAALAMVPLAAFVRFIHFIPPFDGQLLSLHYYLVDLAILIVISLVSFRITRVRQMIRQYSWLYEKTSPFTWKEKTEA